LAFVASTTGLRHFFGDPCRDHLGQPADRAGDTAEEKPSVWRRREAVLSGGLPVVTRAAKGLPHELPDARFHDRFTASVAEQAGKDSGSLGQRFIDGLDVENIIIWE